ncbi:MAG: aa3-type cytochrome c oxidase subunit IV [Novosphingobium sp.]
MASGNDMKAAEATYGGFVSLIKYSIPAIAIIAAIVIKLIA